MNISSKDQVQFIQPISNSMIVKNNDKRGKQSLQFFLKSQNYPRTIEFILRASSITSEQLPSMICLTMSQQSFQLELNSGQYQVDYLPIFWNTKVIDDQNKAFLLPPQLLGLNGSSQRGGQFELLSQLIWPIFGESKDFLKCNDYNKKRSFAHQKIQSSWGKNYKNGQESHSGFSGVTKGCNLKVLEWEVYRIGYE